MRILVTNDDGYEAFGIRELVRVLGQNHEVIVCCPEIQQSGASHSAGYYRREMNVHVREMPGAQKAWTVDGTPVDSVYVGATALLKEPVDLCISGINHGLNVSTDTHYSGTVGAGFEAMMRGFPAMAVSLACWKAEKQEQFHDAAVLTERLAEWFVQQRFCRDILLNVNLPLLPLAEIKGLAVVTCQMQELYTHMPSCLEESSDYMKLRFNNEQVRTDCSSAVTGDISAVYNGYAALTPLRLNWADEGVMRQMEEQKQKLGGMLK